MHTLYTLFGRTECTQTPQQMRHTHDLFKFSWHALYFVSTCFFFLCIFFFAGFSGWHFAEQADSNSSGYHMCAAAAAMPVCILHSIAYIGGGFFSISVRLLFFFIFILLLLFRFVLTGIRRKCDCESE